MKEQTVKESNETAEFLIFLTNEFALIYLIVQISLIF